MDHKLRVGVVGVRRGFTLARECQMVGMDVLAHDMEGVILANSFDEHAPLAVKALQAGKHVMSETAACKSLAEGVQLLRTVEQTGLVYLFAANYPFMPHVRELRRLYRAGEIGTVQYAECEYLHGFSPDYRTHFGSEPQHHWRLRISSLAYCTHAVTPVMYVTDAVPIEVSAFVIPGIRSPSSYDESLLTRGDRLSSQLFLAHRGTS